MRQRTSLTPEDVEQEESVGIPTTIEWAADEVSVEEEPRIPLKIEVMKVRAPRGSSRGTGSRGSLSASASGGRRRSIPVEEEEDEDDANDDSGHSESTRKLRMDDFLYGDGSMPSPPANLLKLKLELEQEEQDPDEEEEHDALAAMGSFLVAGAMQACQDEQDEEEEHYSKEIQVSSRTCPVRRALPTTRRSSRQRQGSPTRGVTRSNSASCRIPPHHHAPPRVEIGVDFSAPPCPSTRRSHTVVRQGSSTSIVTNRSSLSMIFGGASMDASACRSDAGSRQRNNTGGASVTSSLPSIVSAGTSTLTGKDRGCKELSNRTMQTTSTHTHTTSLSTGTSTLPPLTPMHSTMKDQSQKTVSDLGASSYQDHSACIGYVMDESHNTGAQGTRRRSSGAAERRTSVDKKPVLPPTTARSTTHTKLPPRRSCSMTHESIPKWDSTELPPKTSTATATSTTNTMDESSSREFPAGCGVPTWQDLASRKPTKKSSKGGWKKLFPRKSMTATRR